MSSASALAISTVKENLHLVFEEVDATKRKATISKLWVKSEDAVFVDPDHVWRGHDGIDQCVAALVDRFKGWVFVELGSPQVLPESGPEGGLQIVRLHWGYGPPGEEPKVMGQDVATLVDGKLQMLVAILAPVEGES